MISHNKGGLRRGGCNGDGDNGKAVKLGFVDLTISRPPTTDTQHPHNHPPPQSPTTVHLL
ncbi:hypothetical protein Hanom_Chr02g00167371 [Helianthus anomalus]